MVPDQAEPVRRWPGAAAGSGDHTGVKPGISLLVTGDLTGRTRPGVPSRRRLSQQGFPVPAREYSRSRLRRPAGEMNLRLLELFRRFQAAGTLAVGRPSVPVAGRSGSLAGPDLRPESPAPADTGHFFPGLYVLSPETAGPHLVRSHGQLTRISELQRLLDDHSGQVSFHIRNHAGEIRARINFQDNRAGRRPEKINSGMAQADGVSGSNRQVSLGLAQIRGNLGPPARDI